MQSHAANSTQFEFERIEVVVRLTSRISAKATATCSRRNPGREGGVGGWRTRIVKDTDVVIIGARRRQAAWLALAWRVLAGLYVIVLELDRGITRRDFRARRSAH